VKELKNIFSVITFDHVYREENQEADFLSKKALTDPLGTLFYNQQINGHEEPNYQLKMY